ncbi:MAG: ribonuclease III [Bacteriovoracaceae bacterium]|nr:ribonuclease III [Bacteriovoracaceae bacterium]
MGNTEMLSSISADFYNQMVTHTLSSKADLESFFYKHKSTYILEQLIGHSFKKRNLLYLSMLHSSFSNEYSSMVTENNEKLEFLGDSILGAVVAAEIFVQFEGLNEGQLSKLKGALVNEEALAELSAIIKLDGLIFLGKGEFQTGGLGRASILSDAFEALVGAVYLDGGMLKATRLLNNIFALYEKNTGKRFISSDRLDNFDSKTKLQEITMKLYKSLPEYRSIQNKDSTFTVELFINNKSVAEITDISKKRAQKELALAALENELYKGE